MKYIENRRLYNIKANHLESILTMVKNSLFITLKVGKRKYQVTTSDLKRFYKLNRGSFPRIPVYDISNLYRVELKSPETSYNGTESSDDSCDIEEKSPPGLWLDKNSSNRALIWCYILFLFIFGSLTGRLKKIWRTDFMKKIAKFYLPYLP